MSRFKHHEIVLEDLKNIEDLLLMNLAKSKQYFNTYNDYDLALEEYIEELLIKQMELEDLAAEYMVDLLGEYQEPKKTIGHLRLVKG